MAETRRKSASEKKCRSSHGRAKPAPEKSPDQRAFSSLFSFFREKALGKSLLCLFLLLVLPALNLLLSWNQLDRFLLFCGLELLALLIIAWSLFLYRRHQNSGRKNE